MGYSDIQFPGHTTFLVTGGAGFIGSSICEALLGMGHEVRCLDDFSAGKRANIAAFADHSSFTLIEGDIRDLDTCLKACDGVEYVSHQAAWGSVPRSVEMPLVYEEINIRGTLNMLEAARRTGARRFVYASSSSVYGDTDQLPQREGHEGKVLSPYALTKQANEEFARLYTSLYGLKTIGLRYFNVFGKRQDPEGDYAAVIPRFIKTLLAGEVPVIYGNGRQSRDFTYIENVIEANLKAMLAPSAACGMAFNIAYGGQVILIDLTQKLCDLLGVEVEPIFGPEREGDIVHSFADITRAREMLGYDPDWDFTRGIEAAVGWYRENL